MRSISFVVLSAALVCSVPAAAKTQDAPDQQSLNGSSDKKVCRRLKMTGSRMHEKVCLTKEEWKKVEEVK